MKEVVIDKVVKETWYEAIDGQQFRIKDECKKYEESAKCVLLAKYKQLVVKTVSEYDLHDAGSEEYMMDVVKINDDKDIDVIMQLYALYYSSPCYRQYDDKYRKMCKKAFQENDYIFIAVDSCGEDIFSPQYTRNELIAKINSICDERSSD